MMRSLPGSDAWLSPPEPKVPPSGDSVIYVEREVAGEDVELGVAVWFDEGSIWKAKLDGAPFELTADEKQRAEEDWALDCAENPPERDDGERDYDR